MRKKILPLLKCPETHQPGLNVYATEVIRNGNVLYNLHNNELQENDDIHSGIIYDSNKTIAYPIDQSIAILLSYTDSDPAHHIPVLESIKTKCPAELHPVIETTIQKLVKSVTTADGTWNRDEMRYYDSEVDTSVKRDKMLNNIRNTPVHRILIPRKKYITGIISGIASGSAVLEIGCGNASTVYNIFNPGLHNFQYVGSDISFRRLLVAKSLIPEGDFIQASALNLPFNNESFAAIISFGMLHHLPRPVDAVHQVMPLLRKNGMFGFHEPIERKTVHFPGMIALKKAMMTYEHSEHDGKIVLPDILSALQHYGCKIIQKTGQISTFRSALETLVKRMNRKIMLNRNVILFFENTDKIILTSLGKFTKKIGPKAILVVVQKSSV